MPRRPRSSSKVAPQDSKKRRSGGEMCRRCCYINQLRGIPRSGSSLGMTMLRRLLPGLLASGRKAGNRGAAVSGSPTRFEQGLQAIEIFVQCTLGISAKDCGNCMTQRAGWRHVGQIQIDASAGARETFQAQSTSGADRGTGQASPRQQLIGLVTVDLRVPFNAGSSRSYGYPM